MLILVDMKSSFFFFKTLNFNSMRNHNLRNQPNQFSSFAVLILILTTLVILPLKLNKVEKSTPYYY